MVGGNWSADLFEDPVGRSRWDYAQERLSSRAASLNRLPGGELVVTPWAATAPAFVYGEGVTLDRSLAWSPVDLAYHYTINPINKECALAAKMIHSIMIFIKIYHHRKIAKIDILLFYISHNSL